MTAPVSAARCICDDSPCWCGAGESYQSPADLSAVRLAALRVALRVLGGELGELRAQLKDCFIYGSPAARRVDCISRLSELERRALTLAVRED